jgi:predicted CxxxxCH...CXXCH cytochrome family protein
MVAMGAPCETCHRVPTSIDDPNHLNGVVEVELGGLAAARGIDPSFDATVGSCYVACHGAGIDGGAVPTPRWALPEEVFGRCDACHGLPPAESHPVPGFCSSVLCHGGEVAETPGGARITEPGRAIHVDGMVNAGGDA